MGRSYAGDAVGRATAIVQPYGNGQQARELVYDVVGRLINFVDRRTWTDSTYICPDDGFTSCYWQVTSAQATPNQGTFTWDAVGNWATTPGVVVGPGNRLTSYAGYTLAYDLDGNLVSKTGNGLTQTFAWNSLGQFASVTTNGTTTTFAYDAWGRRVQKTTPGVGTSNYLLDGATLVAELNAALQPVREYTYYPGTDRPHSVRTGGTAGATYYYLYEEPGHVVGLVNATGTLVNAYTYAPFGAALSTTEAVAQPLRFTARELDSETGLYYYRARYYDPSLARFVSEDPIGLAGGINQYAYVGDDPINATDPSGTCPGGWWYWGNHGEMIVVCPVYAFVADWPFSRNFGGGRAGVANPGDGQLPSPTGDPGSPGALPDKEARTACGPTLTQPGVVNSANRIWSQYLADPAHREWGENLVLGANGSLNGRTPTGYNYQTGTSAQFYSTPGQVGTNHTHPRDGRNGLWGDWNKSREDDRGGGIKIVTTKDSLFLLPSYPSLVFSLAVTEACARSKLRGTP